jgi:hypothetical protein
VVQFALTDGIMADGVKQETASPSLLSPTEEGK